MGKNLRVVVVDDASLYTRRLLEGFKEFGTDCILYGPLSPPATKSREIMETLGPDGIRVWSQNLFPFQVLKRAIRDKPTIVHVQFEFYGIHSYGPLYTSVGMLLLLIMLRLLRLKTVVTLHSVLPRGKQLTLIRDTSPSSKRVPTAVLEALLTLSYNTISWLSDAVVVHAEVFKKRLSEHYRVKSSKVVVIPHGVERFESSTGAALPMRIVEQNSILYFGVISPRKGLETLLSAFAAVLESRADCTLLLAGASPPYYKGYEATLKSLAEKLGLGEKVLFLGFVDNKLARLLFTQTKFIVLPYFYDVSASGALSWALGYRLPVIASETEYFKEELAHSQFGLLVPPGNPKMLAEAMETLLAREDVRSSLSENAWKMALSRSWRTTAMMTLSSYRNMESDKGGHERKAL